MRSLSAGRSSPRFHIQMDLPIFLRIFTEAPKNDNNFHTKDSPQFRSARCRVDHLSTQLDLAEAFLKWSRFLALSSQMSAVKDSAGPVRGGNQEANSLVCIPCNFLSTNAIVRWNFLFIEGFQNLEVFTIVQY